MAVLTTTKLCLRCEAEKDVSDFGRNAAKPDGLASWCRSCQNTYSVEYYQANKSASHASYLKRTYGLTQEDYICLLDAQGGACAICGGNDNRRLSVDHDHETGRIRALLCTSCNASLAILENKELCEKMMDYLAGHRG